MASNNLQKFTLKLQSAIASLTTKDHMIAVGNFVVNKIRVRTRLGYGVAKHGGEKTKLKPLSPRYVKSRMKMKGLSQLTTPKKSNLTRTGSMLDSLKVKGFRENAILIQTSGRDRYGVSNEDKATWNEEKGRPFIYMSDSEIKQARIFWLRRFNTLLKKINLG